MSRVAGVGWWLFGGRGRRDCMDDCDLVCRWGRGRLKRIGPVRFLTTPVRWSLLTILTRADDVANLKLFQRMSENLMVNYTSSDAADTDEKCQKYSNLQRLLIRFCSIWGFKKFSKAHFSFILAIGLGTGSQLPRVFYSQRCVELWSRPLRDLHIWNEALSILGQKEGIGSRPVPHLIWSLALILVNIPAERAHWRLHVWYSNTYRYIGKNSMGGIRGGQRKLKALTGWVEQEAEHETCNMVFSLQWNKTWRRCAFFSSFHLTQKSVLALNQCSTREWTEMNTTQNRSF